MKVFIIYKVSKSFIDIFSIFIAQLFPVFLALVYLHFSLHTFFRAYHHFAYLINNSLCIQCVYLISYLYIHIYIFARHVSYWNIFLPCISRKNFLLNLHKIGSTYNIHVFEYIAAKFSHIFTNTFTCIFRTFRVYS